MSLKQNVQIKLEIYVKYNATKLKIQAILQNQNSREILMFHKLVQKAFQNNYFAKMTSLKC